MTERDSMICRACGREERASEGYPCNHCGTFICQICALRGVTLCSKCAADAGGGADGSAAGSADGSAAAPPPA